MLLVIQTQNQENYGAHDWDGKGACPQYWKMKGGSEYKITGLAADADIDAVVDCVSDKIEESNEGFRVNIVGYGLEADDYLSWFERSQLEYDGEIACPEPTFAWDAIVDEIMGPGYAEVKANESYDADAQYYGA